MHLLLVRRRFLQGFQLLLVLACLWAGAARGQGVELAALQVRREDGALTLDFAARVTLPPAVEDALQRGRWYWRDERVARVSRSWRVAYQPLTNTWRVGLGGLHQTFDTLNEALGAASRSAGWKLAELASLDPDSRYTVEFSYRLDNSQLPSPMLIGLIGGSEFSIGVERTLRLE